ncbi:MAG TPA: hypothetical protein VE549_02335 [Myxococcaceae bacterium]|nr:hypothetical protein [Myxococcaceae bacterium]
MRWRREAFPLQGVVAVAVVGLALFLCWWAWPEGGSARKAAAEGVLLCAGSGAVSFALQRRTRTVRQALLVLVVMFGVRILIVVLGATAAIRGGGAGAMPFVYGFFGTYFPLQWLEIWHLLAENERAKRVK